MDLMIQDKIALVTGSTLGIGFATVKKLLEEGATVYLNGRTKQSVDNAIERIKKEIPIRKLGNIEDLAKAVQFIVENEYFNGKVLEIDGGMTLSHG